MPRPWSDRALEHMSQFANVEESASIQKAIAQEFPLVSSEERADLGEKLYADNNGFPIVPQYLWKAARERAANALIPYKAHCERYVIRD